MKNQTDANKAFGIYEVSALMVYVCLVVIYFWKI